MHDVHLKETKVQLMLDMHRLFIAQDRLNFATAASAPSAESAPSAAPPSWEKVAKEMSTTKPHFADCAKEAADFAAAWSGGLNEVEAYAKSLAVRKEPEHGQLGILANAQLKRAPRWPIACLKTLLQAPGEFCRRKGFARMFTTSHIEQMETSLNPQIMEACELMEQARAWLGPDIYFHPGLKQKLLSDMDVRLVMHVHGFATRINSRRLYPHLKAIAQQFAEDVQDAGGDLTNCPWKLPTAEPAPGTAASAPKVDPATGDEDRANMHRSTSGHENSSCNPVLTPILQYIRPLKGEKLQHNANLASLYIEPRVSAAAPSPKERAAASALQRLDQPRIAGRLLHSSHQLCFHRTLQLWFCSCCGCYAREQPYALSLIHI